MSTQASPRVTPSGGEDGVTSPVLVASGIAHVPSPPDAVALVMEVKPEADTAAAGAVSLTDVPAPATLSPAAVPSATSAGGDAVPPAPAGAGAEPVARVSVPLNPRAAEWQPARAVEHVMAPPPPPTVPFSQQRVPLVAALTGDLPVDYRPHALFLAIAANDLAVIRALMLTGVGANWTTTDGWMPASYARARGVDRRCVTALLNSCPYEMSPMGAFTHITPADLAYYRANVLLQAASCGHEDVVDALVGLRPNPFSVTDLAVARDSASKRGHTDIAEQLHRVLSSSAAPSGPAAWRGSAAGHHARRVAPHAPA